MLLILWGLFSIISAKPIENRLDNGMQIITDHSDHIPQVSMQLHFSFAPESYPEGLAHLVEHLLFEMEKDGFLYDHWVEKHQGVSNAKTRWSELIIETTISSEAVDELLAWEAWRMQNFCSSLTTENIENQKMIIVQEMLNLEFRHLGSVPDRLRKSVFSMDSVLGAEVMGSVADLEMIGKEDLCRFASEVLHPSRARLILAGDISKGKQYEWRNVFVAGEDSPPILTSKGKYAPTRWYLPSEKETRLYIIWRSPKYGDKNEIASDFILEQLISEQLGILSNYFPVSGWSENSDSVGWRVIEIETEDPEEALKTVEQILDSGADWLKPKDLQLFQIKTKSLIAKLQLKNTERARLLGECSLIGKGEECFIWEQERRQELSLEEALLYLENDFVLENASLLWIGSDNRILGERLP